MRKLPLAAKASILPALFLLALLANASAQEQTDEPPKIALCVPLGIKAGETTRLTIRGWKLDQASEVKCNLESATVKVINKGSAPVPGGQDASRIGDTQIEIEVMVPEGTGVEYAELTVIAGGSTSAPHRLLIGGTSLVAEQEPNNGFDEAQQIELPQTVEGLLHADRNVEVFSFKAEAGRTIAAEVVAHRHGSALDSIVSLYDANRQLLKTVDDVVESEGADTRDARLEYPCRHTGTYYLVIQDALDRGGPAHPWRLIVELR